MEKWPIGVFTSVDTGLGLRLDLAPELGISTIQMHAPSPAQRAPAAAEALKARLAALGLRLTAIFGGFEGESYADIPTTARTVGLVPPETRAARLQEMKEISDFAARLGVPVVALHLGFVPHDPQAPLYAEVVAITRELCDYVAARGQALHLETGQETADDLLRFIGDVGRGNLFVNFDPANMILYGSGEPIAAVRKLGPLVRSVHLKDAKWAARPGQEWGAEVPLGQGDVGIENYLRALDEAGYHGPLTIEREIPQEVERQKSEIGHAAQLLHQLKAKLG